jgi:hypothetical protein
MPTDRPRIQVTLDKDTNAMLAAFAAHKECSLSAAASKLIEEALELQEDMALSTWGDKRLKETKEWISHDEVWSDVK